MEGNIYQSKIYKYKACCRGFIKFENYLKQKYNNLEQKFQKHKGYLIDLKEFEQYKNDLLYQVYKNNKKNMMKK